MTSDKDKLISVVNDITATFCSLQKAAEPYIQAWDQIRENLQKAIEPYVQISQAIGQQLQDFAIIIRPSIKYYLIKDSHFYISDKIFLSELDEKHTETIDTDILLSYIEEFYLRDNFKELIRLFSEWNSIELIKERLPILNSCRSAIIAQLETKDIANIVIPVLIAQIDGMTKDFYIKLDPSLKENKLINHHDIITANQNFNELSCCDIADICYILHYLFYFDSGIYYFDKEKKRHDVIEKASEDKLQNYVLNRNGIMHGSTLDYGNKVELIRLVLFFDTILNSMNNILNEIDSEKTQVVGS